MIRMSRRLVPICSSNSSFLLDLYNTFIDMCLQIAYSVSASIFFVKKQIYLQK